ncbi:DUF5677 domain-containing protein [Pseudomonas sp. GM60]|uniref:DUF5677 domain-containing protein n=1 Tax=Pseudomonas sp. GM60 TaxID=1144334 RepID=UPI00027096D7|nr:DUF5677 domain-containing protein [Pseudomonas sp. GM60]EJM74049.1 hypothetical protein PMI32_05544 [Pseudomonas sp. GM60]
MQSDKSLNDYMVEGNENQLKTAIQDMHRKFIIVSEWIAENTEHTNDNLVFLNLFRSTIDYIEVLNTSINQHISILGLATRSLYELNLQLRLALKDPAYIQAWCSEVITDKIQIYEGILGIQSTTETTQQKLILQTEIEKLHNLRVKYQLPAEKSTLTAAQKAKSLGISNEHSNLYRLFSKIVHPSSYLVNDRIHAASLQTQIILQIRAQLYAWDTFSRTSDYFNIPEDLKS